MRILVRILVRVRMLQVHVHCTREDVSGENVAGEVVAGGMAVAGDVTDENIASEDVTCMAVLLVMLFVKGNGEEVACGCSW